MMSAPALTGLFPLIPLLLILLLVSFFRIKSRDYPYTEMFSRERIRTGRGYIAKRAVKLLLFALISALLLLASSGYSSAAPKPVKLYVYVEYSTDMEKNSMKLNSIIDSILKTNDLRSAEVCISGKKFRYPVSGFESCRFESRSKERAASLMEKYFKDALSVGGCTVLISGGGFEVYGLSSADAETGILVKDIRVKFMGGAAEVYSVKDTLCSYIFYDSEGRITDSGEADLKRGMNIIKSAGGEAVSIRIGNDYFQSEASKNAPEKIDLKIESVFLKGALKSLGYETGEGKVVDYSSGEITFSRPKSRTIPRKTFAVAIDRAFGEIIKDSFEIVLKSSPDLIKGRVLMRTSLNEPLAAVDEGKIHFAFSPDTINSDIPLHPEFLPILDASIRMVSSDSISKQNMEVSSASVREAERGEASVFHRDMKIPLSALILAIIYAVL